NQLPARVNRPRGVRSTDVALVLSAVTDLAAIADAEQLLKRAVEVASECIGVERVALFARDSFSSDSNDAVCVLRGTWALDPLGRTFDARTLHYESGGAEQAELLALHDGGQLWKHYPRASDYAHGVARRIGPGWLVVTPLIAGGDLVGVMHNGADAARPIDHNQQAQVAVYCSVLATLIASRRAYRRWTPSHEPIQSGVIGRAMTALAAEPALRGAVLARDLDVSAGHLARSFKREVGCSLVEYRQRVLLDRFFMALDTGKVTLFAAARQAGFRSYTQFYRVYRKLVGSAPRDALVVAPRRR
ncbi:MAG TPA: helix-turn-helix domain-containing protein, partial [Polyangiaceae bacterium]|nr:helix-turn-helix domain-containing protein [Polyangiaceae bacterium]